MKLSELIAACGDDKVEFQNLDQSLISVDFNAKRGSKITFGTSMTAGLDGTDKLGLVVAHPIAIKPLEWHGSSADSPVGEYIARKDFDLGDDAPWDLELDGLKIGGVFAALREAKAAAQADYEARILSALTPSPSAGAGLIAEHLTPDFADDGNCCAGKLATPPATPVQPTASVEAVIEVIWTAAFTAACNIVIKRQNDLNDDDGPIAVLNEQGDIIAALKKWLRPDSVYLDELRGMLDDAGASLTPAPTQGDGAWRDVLAERRRQIEAEGWSPKHDDEHDAGQLALAAGSYAIVAGLHPNSRRAFASRNRDGNLAPWPNWPWSTLWWKPTDRRRDLVKAGALILAEIERLDRKEAAL